MVNGLCYLVLSYVTMFTGYFKLYIFLIFIYFWNRN